jgi:hypothetical protein
LSGFDIQMGAICSKCWNLETVPKYETLHAHEIPQRDSPALDFVDNPEGVPDSAPLLTQGAGTDIAIEDEQPLDEATIQRMLNEVDELSD